MPSFHTVLAAVLSLTILSGAAATAIAVMGDTRKNETQRKLVEKLSHVTILGAAAIITLLSRMGSG